MKKTVITVIISVLISAIIFGTGGFFLSAHINKSETPVKTAESKNEKTEYVSKATKDEFFDALITGLNKRIENEKSTEGMDFESIMRLYKNIVTAELEVIEKYYNADFGDKIFNTLVNQYIEAVRVQHFSTVNSNNESFSSNTFAAGLITRSSIILEFCKEYGLELTDEQINNFLSSVPDTNSYQSLKGSGNNNPTAETEFDENAVINELDISSRYYNDSYYNNVVFLIKNNSLYNLEFELQCFAYDEAGNVIEIQEKTEYLIGSEATKALEISFESTPHSYSYKISVSPSMYSSGHKSLKAESSISGKNAVISITNNGNKTVTYTYAYIIFKKGDTVVDYDYTIVGDVNSNIQPGKTEIKQISSSSDFDNIEVYYDCHY